MILVKDLKMVSLLSRWGQNLSHLRLKLVHFVIYSGISIIQTLDFSKLPILRAKSCFPWICSSHIFTHHFKFSKKKISFHRGSENRYSTLKRKTSDLLDIDFYLYDYPTLLFEIIRSCYDYTNNPQRSYRL